MLKLKSINLSIFTNHRFQAYAIGLAFDRFGNALYSFVLPLLVYSITSSVLNMSIMAIFQLVPRILIGAISGVIVDIYSRRYIIFASLICQAICSILLAFMFYSNFLEIYIIYLMGAILSMAFEFGRTAEISVVPDMFKEQRVEATSFLATIFTAMFFLGPAISGLLILISNYGTLLLINSITYFIPIIMCIWSKIPHNSSKNKVNKSNSLTKFFLKEFLLGVIYLWNISNFRYLFFMVFLYNLAIGNFSPLTIFLFKEYFNVSDSQIGFIFTANGVGMLLATIFTNFLKNMPRWNLILLILILCIIAIGLLFSNIIFIAILGSSLLSFGIVALSIVDDILLQDIIPSNFLGRASSILRIVRNITIILSLTILSFVSNFLNIYYAFSLSLIILLLTTVTIFMAKKSV